MKKNVINYNFKVACVIVTYNNSNVIGKTLSNLFSQTYPLGEIIIVDNASPDGTASLIAKNYPNVTLFANALNTGIGEGYAIGMEYAHEKRYDWIWLLDGDSTPEFNALEELIKAYSHPKLKGVKIGILASSPVNRKTHTRYNCANWRGGRYVEVPISESATEPIFVDIVISSGSLINRKIIDEVGLPRADFFIDFVDIEYDFRIANKRYKVVLVPQSIIYHEIGNTKVVRSITRLGAKYPSYIHPPWRLYYIVRNEMYTFLHEFHDYKFIIFFLLRISRAILIMSIYNHDRKLQRFNYILLGFKDGIKGRLGKVYGPDR